MLLVVKKTVETSESIEVKTPSYWKSTLKLAMISESGDIIKVGNNMIVRYEKGSLFQNSEINEIIRDYTECSAEEFLTAYDRTTQDIEAQFMTLRMEKQESRY